MSSSMCPHLVQEYFERVSDILVTYRPQILKQVEYDRISENMVLRGAVRQEEHERIDNCEDCEGRVSQLLVVVQNRMWGLENLLAAFMEEHVSTWLTQEMFRAYMEHLVHPLKKLQDNPQCQCALMSNSYLYKGWVKALKSLDALILKAGNSLGFMKQTLYPTDNMLSFLSDKLAECTGGDSVSSRQEELVPYGFAPSASGEVQVAELEEDDINDLISLTAMLPIAYHSNEFEEPRSSEKEESIGAIAILKKVLPEETPKAKSTTSASPNIRGLPIMAKPLNRKSSLREKRSPPGRSPEQSKLRKQRTISDQTVQSENIGELREDKEKTQQRQKMLMDRLSAPKSNSSSASSVSSVRLRNSNSGESKRLSKPRPKSAELHRSTSMSPTISTATPLVKLPNSPTPASSSSTMSRIERKSTPTTGKATGFVRSKSVDQSNSKTRSITTNARSSPSSRPTAVTKPNLKKERGNVKQEESKENVSKQEKKITEEVEFVDAGETKVKVECATHTAKSDSDQKGENCISSHSEDTFDIDDLQLPEMSSLLLRNSILSPEEEHAKKLGYYQLNFDLDNE